MIVCERDFESPDHADPRYSLAEVDMYAWVPAGSGARNHRLSLRRNLVTGEFEVYRRYVTRVAGQFAGAVIVTNVDDGDEEVAFTGSLEGALQFGNREWNAFHATDDHEREEDRACEHGGPSRAYSCDGG